MLRFIESSKLPTRWGTFDIHGFEDPFKGKEHIAITMGDCAADEPLLIRIHSECLTGERWAVCAATVASSCKNQ